MNNKRREELADVAGENLARDKDAGIMMRADEAMSLLRDAEEIAANLALLEGLEPGDRLILPNGDVWHFLVFMDRLRIGRSPGMSFAVVDVMLGWLDAAIRGGARVVKAGGA